MAIDRRVARSLISRPLPMVQLLAFVIAAWVMAGSALAAPPEFPLKTSASTDVSDIWYDPAKSGKGVQMVQTGTFVFVTVFIYGTDQKATWVTGELVLGANLTFTGLLFVNTGPPYTGPFNPANVINRQAGTMTFVLQTPNTGTLTYTVDGVVVTEALQRQPLTLDNYTGQYLSLFTQATTNCDDPTRNIASTGPLIVTITQNGPAVTFQFLSSFSGGGDGCSVIGTYSQLGRNGRVQGPYACTQGQVGNADISEMNNRVKEFSARVLLASTNDGCRISGRIIGLIPDGNVSIVTPSGGVGEPPP